MKEPFKNLEATIEVILKDSMDGCRSGADAQDVMVHALDAMASSMHSLISAVQLSYIANRGAEMLDHKGLLKHMFECITQRVDEDIEETKNSEEMRQVQELIKANRRGEISDEECQTKLEETFTEYDFITAKNAAQ